MPWYQKSERQLFSLRRRWSRQRPHSSIWSERTVEVQSLAIYNKFNHASDESYFSCRFIQVFEDCKRHCGRPIGIGQVLWWIQKRIKVHQHRFMWYQWTCVSIQIQWECLGNYMQQTMLLEKAPERACLRRCSSLLWLWEEFGQPIRSFQLRRQPVPKQVIHWATSLIRW